MENMKLAPDNAQSSQKPHSRRTLVTVLKSLIVVGILLVVLNSTGKLDRIKYRPLRTDWVEVPAGEFLMGTDESFAHDSAKPAHAVYLDTYQIMMYEVTNKQYAQCLHNGACEGGGYVYLIGWELLNRLDYKTYEEHPVSVNWIQAETYCNWIGARLPTEAEWEKAARGENALVYPWGNDKPNADLLNYNTGNTTEVGSYPKDASPYGAFDMAGNVSEWVNDWYSDTYYQNSSSVNPSGPASGKYRVVRGGYYDSVISIKSSNRIYWDPKSVAQPIGFRCAMSVPK